MRRTIMIADNDSDYRSSARGWLETEGWGTLGASTVAEALQRLEDTRVDLILLDVRMTEHRNEHDYSGLDVALEAHRRGVPCIVVTDFPTVAAARRALRAHGAAPLAFDFVPKEDGPQGLLGAMAKIKGLTLLHISDLHLTLPPPFDQERALELLPTDLEKQPGIGLNPIRGIVVSGDVSFQCRPETFERAYTFLERLSSGLGISLDHVVLAPGNHDVDRDLARSRPDLKLDRFLAFSERFYDGQQAFSQDRHFRIFNFDDQAAVVAFDSCAREASPNTPCGVCRRRWHKDHYYGWLAPEDVQQAGAALDELGHHGLRIAVWHHHVVPEGCQPPHGDCLGGHLWNYHGEPDFIVHRLFGQGFRIVLHGHRHQRQLMQSLEIGAKKPYTLGGGTLWPSDNDEGTDSMAAYLLLQLATSRGSSCVVARKYRRSTGHMAGDWGPDEDVRENGIIPLHDGIALQTPDSEGSAADPATHPTM